MTDVITTAVAYAGTVTHAYRNIKKIHQWMNNNGFHVAFLKRSDEYDEAWEELQKQIGRAGLTLHSFQYEYHHIGNLSEYLSSIHGHKLLDSTANKNSFTQHNGTHLALPVFHVSSKADDTHHVKIRMHDVSASNLHMDLGYFPRDLLKRANEYKDEYFTDGDGVTTYFCINEGQYDEGNIDPAADWPGIREDVACHQSNDLSDSGIYVQLFDKDAKNTICSGSLAPYTPSKKSTIDHMSKCPSGIANTCGST